MLLMSSPATISTAPVCKIVNIFFSDFYNHYDIVSFKAKIFDFQLKVRSAVSRFPIFPSMAS